MTPNKEDYLKKIYELGGTDTKINNKEIVKGLEVSAASVSEMMTKLLKEGFIERIPYQGVQLTAEGLRKASILVRKHRLWEVFLVEHLCYSWNQVHEEAEILEHVSSTELTNRLEAYLDYPTVCPHGGMIPNKEGVLNEPPLQTLAEKKVNEKIVIKRVADQKDLLDYLVSVGVKVNDEYTISDIGAYEGPITIEKGQASIPISFKAATSIYVEAI
ncbi:metal-dependent transcriptional regulator [Carnobacterium sp. CS13]|uniref:metal-dependent transcriptional regulator n=1 Tax=Carnobacterium sp. CS13 TaxID=2800128 RepID=UPI001912EE3C|nr:metal-dependent transcriptional regulator [Carnobacterium sp. CS13]QQP70862.1 metal-dependent transcriptional regulator [Carnobacterium sp. CS13]